MLITLSELKSYLWISDDSEDAILNIFVDSASSFVKSYLDRNIEKEDYTEYEDGDAQRIIVLDNYPVNSITSFEYNEWTIDSPDFQEIDASKYKLKPETGKIFLTFYKTRWFQNYKIKYNAGYDSIPWDLKLATLKLAASYYNWKESDGVDRETVAGDSISFETQEINSDVLAILNEYKDV